MPEAISRGSASPTSTFSHQSLSESGCSHASTILPCASSARGSSGSWPPAPSTDGAQPAVVKGFPVSAACAASTVLCGTLRRHAMRAAPVPVQPSLLLANSADRCSAKGALHAVGNPDSDMTREKRPADGGDTR